MATRVKPQDKTVAVNGLTLHYLDWGDAGKPALVLLHGLRGHAHSWDDVSEAMCRDFHVLALDQRGRGGSDWAPGGDYTAEAYVADLAAFTEALGLARLILVGHSMGGRNSMLFAAEYPERVEKLIIVDWGPVADPKEAERIIRDATDFPDEFDSFEAAVEHISKQNPLAADNVLRRRLQYATKESPNGKIGWRYDPVITEQRRRSSVTPADGLWSSLRQVTCPTLIIRGPESYVLSVDMAHKMEEELVRGKLVQVPKAGHMVFEDNPEDFNAQLASFLGR